jgi:phosphatidate cytidylyltransferase
LKTFPGLGSRVLVAVPGIVIFLWVILFGGPAASLVLFSLLGVLAGYEAVSLCLPSSPVHIRLPVGLAAGFSTLLVGIGSPLQTAAVLLPGVCFALWWIPCRAPRGARAEMLGVMGLTLFYTAGFGILARLSIDWPHRGIVLIPLASCWIGDSFAYFAGCRWGRHKMIPKVSPGKSWEGFAAGLAGSVAGAMAVGWGGMAPVHLAVAGIVCGIAAVFGDLFESAVKRDSGVKDSGSFLGAHGGILDRFDSVAAAAPAALAVLHLFGPGAG